MSRYITFVISILLFFLSVSIQTASSAKAEFCLDTRWPSEQSELEADPSLHRGKLDNGFRYIIKQNTEPENRVAVYLNVQAGSLYEEENQRGLAHFLEHLMFNGSTNFPPGSLVEFFQSIGMSFGGDTNAHTSYEETVYHIILPGGEEKDLDTGLLVLTDYARGALLLDEEIDRERGVILAERRARDSAGYRVHVAESDFAFRGTKYPLRRPIGEKQVIEYADQKLLRSFYDTWYRPENMSIVLVGDTDPKLAARLIEKHFAGLVATGPKPKCPDFGLLEHRGLEVFYSHEPELGKVDVSLETLWDIEPENDSIELQKRELLQHIGAMLMGYRLEQLLEKENTPFSFGRYHAGDILHRIGYGAFAAKTDGDRWKQTLALLEQTLRQALLYGFTDHEIDRAKKEILADLETRVVTETSQDSRRIARRIIRHLNSNRVYLSAEQEQGLYAPMVRKATVDDVNRAFRQLWNRNSRLISVTGDVDLRGDSSTRIKRVYEESLSAKISPREEFKKSIFPYLDPPESISQPEKIVHEDLGLVKLVFPRGLVVNLKRTDYDNDRFLLAAHYGRGKMGEPSPGMAMIAEGVVNGSGSGRLTKSTIDSVIAGSSVDISFRAGESFFLWSGSGLVKDFELFTQLLYTLLFDPGVRENVFTRVMNSYELMYQKMDREVEGAEALHVQPFLASYNERFGLPPWERLGKLRFKNLQAWAYSVAAPQDLEISVTGDFNTDEIVALLTHYFGSIAFNGSEKLSPGPVTFPAGKRLELSVPTSMDKALVIVAWPTDDFWDIGRTRRLQMLASVFRDRLRKSIREKLGASYSPRITSFGSRTYPNYGYIKTQMMVEPGRLDAVIEEILSISEELRHRGVSSDELLRAREPMLTTLAGTVKTNRYWLNSVLSLSSRHPQQMEWARTMLGDYKEVTADDLTKLAARYLDNSMAAIIRVRPENNAVSEGRQQPDSTQ